MSASYVVVALGGALLLLILVFATFKVVKAIAEGRREVKKTMEARQCPRCRSTSYKDQTMDGVDIPLEQEYLVFPFLPGETGKHTDKRMVRRICQKCSHVWFIEIAITTKSVPGPGLPDGFYH